MSCGWLKLLPAKKRKRVKGKKNQNFRARRRPKSYSFSFSAAFFVLEEEIRKGQYIVFFSRGILGKQETQKLKFDAILTVKTKTSKASAKALLKLNYSPWLGSGVGRRHHGR